MFTLPAQVQARLEELVQGRPELNAQARALSERYRRAQARGGDGGSLLKDGDALAYACSRMPATYAAVRAALAGAADCLLGEAPRTLLDVGAGPGTATLAALDLWPGIRACLVERDADMAGIGNQLLEAAGARAEWRLGDLRTQALPQADLVIAAYSLLELPDERLEAEALRLFALAEKAFLIVEPGTPDGHKRLMRVRRALLDAGARLAAPCPHESECPLGPDDWCAFSVRLQRSAAHRAQKGGTLGFEDEKFAYLCTCRGEVDRAPARVRRHPLIRKGLVELELCTPQGAERRRYTKSSPLYKRARGVGAGDAFPAE